MTRDVVPKPADADTGASDGDNFAMYSTLSGKMARMEELLGGIGRLIDTTEIPDRAITDAQEFQRLLGESRRLYPSNLAESDRDAFAKTVDQTIALADDLVAALQAGDPRVAAEVIADLNSKRQAAHARFSY